MRSEVSGQEASRSPPQLGDTESAYCTFAHSFAQITSTIFNLQQDKAFADVLKVRWIRFPRPLSASNSIDQPDSKAGLSTLLGALLHYPSHYFALWRVRELMRRETSRLTPNVAAQAR